FAQFKAGAVVMKIAWPGTGALAIAEDTSAPIDRVYLIGLAIFSLTVVGYTLIGGFLAAGWAGLFASVVVFFRVAVLVVLALHATGGLEPAARKAVENVEMLALEHGQTPQEAHYIASQYAAGPGLRAVVSKPAQGQAGSAPENKYIYFLPLTMAFSFFCFWPYGGMASPASVVRIMACKNTSVLR